LIKHCKKTRTANNQNEPRTRKKGAIDGREESFGSSRVQIEVLTINLPSETVQFSNMAY
jgi:hypothetical protein